MGIPEGHENVYYLTSFDNHLILPEIGKCEVTIYETEIPHFQIVNENGSFRCSVRVFENYYFSDDGKYTDTLNNDQLKVFIEWLNKKFPAPSIKCTTWELTKDFCEHYCCEELEYKFMTDNMPDYMSMDSFKDDYSPIDSVKVEAKCILQTANEKNRNGRCYDAKVLFKDD